MPVQKPLIQLPPSIEEKETIIFFDGRADRFFIFAAAPSKDTESRRAIFRVLSRWRPARA